MAEAEVGTVESVSWTERQWRYRIEEVRYRVKKALVLPEGEREAHQARIRDKLKYATDLAAFRRAYGSNLAALPYERVTLDYKLELLLLGRGSDEMWDTEKEEEFRVRLLWQEAALANRRPDQQRWWKVVHWAVARSKVYSIEGESYQGLVYPSTPDQNNHPRWKALLNSQSRAGEAIESRVLHYSQADAMVWIEREFETRKPHQTRWS